MNMSKITTLTALSEVLAQARMKLSSVKFSYRYLKPEEMGTKCASLDGKHDMTPNEVIAAHEMRVARIKAAIRWVKSIDAAPDATEEKPTRLKDVPKVGDHVCCIGQTMVGKVKRVVSYRGLPDYAVVQWPDDINRHHVTTLRVVKSASSPMRDRECMGCGHKWTAPVVLGDTNNISGELTAFCPACNGRGVVSSPVRLDA